MARMGRPRSARAASAQVIRIKLRLYPAEDDDLILFFRDIPRGLRAARVKAALRTGALSTVGTAGAEDESLLDSLEELVF